MSSKTGLHHLILSQPALTVPWGRGIRCLCAGGAGAWVWRQNLPPPPPTPNQGGAPHPSSCLLSLEPDMKGLQTKWGVVIFQQINKVTGSKLFLSSSALCCIGVVLHNDSAVLRGSQLILGKVTFLLLLIVQLPSLSSSFSFTNLHEIMTHADSAVSKY